MLCGGVRLCAETAEKPDSKRFSGIEKAHRNSIKITVDLWRRRWDSNPRTLADQLISSQSRYDHFDTSPYLSQHQHLGKRGELMGRTSKNIKLRIPEKPHKIKGFRSGSYRVATTISSAARYNHFDTLPCINIHFWGLITRFRVSPVMTTSIPLRARGSRAAWISIAHIRKKSISFSK